MLTFLEDYFSNVIQIRSEIWESIGETLFMVGWTALIAGLLGVLLGIVLVVTERGGILENQRVYTVLEKIVNGFRSVPFIIMLALIAPFTRLIIGTSIGTTAAIVPLVVGTVPFYSRQVQNALLEVDSGVIEAAEAMGSSPLEIIFRVYLKEGLPSLIRVSSVTIINLIGITTMAGAIGAGGLGDLAISRGYNRNQMDVTLVCTAVILIIVLISQLIGDYLVRKTSH